MTRDEVKAIFTLAGIEVLNIKALVGGYGYDPDDVRFYDEKPRLVWWFVKTSDGWIEIGWRKHVISIDWTDTEVRTVLTQDDVTKDATMVHAYNPQKAIEYLATWKQALTRMKEVNQPI